MAKQIEFFSAGCPFCTEALALVRRLADDSWTIQVRDVRHDREAQRAARAYGFRSVPAVVLNGAIVVGGQGAVDELSLRQAGLAGGVRGSETDRLGPP